MKTLRFIHITKTAGTSIEHTGKINGISWGLHHSEYGPWHEFFPRKSRALKDKYDWFMVVRNPYTRVVSEFYCHNGGPTNKNVSVNVFNKEIRNRIESRSTFGDHWSEQYKYLDETCVIHILRYENLKEEFDMLMLKYGFAFTLSAHLNKGHKTYTERNLDNDTVSLINHVYQQDFLTFSYDYRNPFLTW